MSIELFFVFCALVLFLTISPKKTIIFYAPMKMLFHDRVMLFAGTSNFTLDGAFSLVVVAYIFMFKRKLFDTTERFPFATCMLFWCLGLLFHSFYPEQHFVTLFLEPLFRDCLFFLILFKLIRDKCDLKLIYKSIFCFVLLLIGNAFVDLVFKTNIIGDFFVNSTGYHFISENNISRFSYQRTPSFMPHAIGMGSICVMILYVLFVFIIHKNQFFKRRETMFFCIVLLFAGIIISNSRTPLLGLIVGVPFLLNKAFLTSKYGRIAIVFSVFFLYIFWGYLEYMYNITFFESKYDAYGSNSDLRERQFAVASAVFLKHPWIGGGNARDILAGFDERDVLGMESIWFPLMYRRGLLGILTYIFILITPLIKFRKLSNYRFIVGFFFVWLVLNSFSSQPGITIGIYFLFMIIIAKESIVDNVKMQKWGL